ncbi:penicillin-binding transpeptidase domain-containing protein [Niallia sp. XMNu-256]|uniref:penicillin-binding transpeptidase domain-containing protein n=1 Tax=Niallia sp. XMNu-256 TaxID=3082444 RepID=UPI0030D4044C
MKKFAMMMILMLAIVTGCNQEPQPSDRLSEYVELWNNQKFAQMYELLTAAAQDSLSKEEFVNRYEKIYSDLEIRDLQVAFEKPENEEVKEESVQYPFSASMESVAGKIEFEHTASLKKETKNDEENWYIDWNTTYIFPQLDEGDKVGLSSTPAKRGEIQDRNGQPLAMNGEVYEIGIVPGSLGEEKEATIAEMASLLGVTVEKINEQLNASWVKPEYFVPIKRVSLEEGDLVAEVTTLPGVQSKKVEARVYPLKEAAAHLTGYIGKITAEELKKLKGKGYNSNDSIGKRGIEQLFDEKLKGQNGVKITINKSDGTQEVLAQKEVKDGENVGLTIDASMQTKVYDQLANDPGTAAVIHPKTGETLGLVSTPSFDPNLLTLGATAEQWKALDDDPLQPLLNRFAANYAPGSVIKPLTAAIGLKEGTLDPSKTMNVSGLQWQKDQSWGNYFVTRVKEASDVDLEKAMLYSDNIYFAQTALDLGKARFVNGLKNFGFEEEIPFTYPLEKSVTGAMDSEVKLADSGYGQGEVEMNIAHLAATYTPFINAGNLIKPTLLLDDEDGVAWKENVISAEQADQISGYLANVVQNPEGTGSSANVKGMNLAGKTGTAEFKAKQGERGHEIGWFVAYNPDLVIAMMVEGVQDKHGSEYVVKKVRNVFEE